MTLRRTTALLAAAATLTTSTALLTAPVHASIPAGRDDAATRAQQALTGLQADLDGPLQVTVNRAGWPATRLTVVRAGTYQVLDATSGQIVTPQVTYDQLTAGDIARAQAAGLPDARWLTSATVTDDGPGTLALPALVQASVDLGRTRMRTTPTGTRWDTRLDVAAAVTAHPDSPHQVDLIGSGVLTATYRIRTDARGRITSITGREKVSGIPTPRTITWTATYTRGPAAITVPTASQTVTLTQMDALPRLGVLETTAYAIITTATGIAAAERRDVTVDTLTTAAASEPTPTGLHAMYTDTGLALTYADRTVCLTPRGTTVTLTDCPTPTAPELP